MKKKKRCMVDANKKKNEPLIPISHDDDSNKYSLLFTHVNKKKMKH